MLNSTMETPLPSLSAQSQSGDSRVGRNLRVIVIGGGPAGSLAATLLARAGVDVTLIEQQRFPRDKVCGECLSALGREVLRRHNLDTELPLGKELTTARIFGRSTDALLQLPDPMLGLSRATLDMALLNAATAAGANLRQPARVEAVESDQTSARVRMRCLVSNQLSTEVADYALTADGRAAFAAPRPIPTIELGVKAHFADVAAEPTAITLYGGFGSYGGVAPIEGNRWNVAFSVPRSVIANAHGNLDEWWNATLSKSAAMRRHFAGARRVSDWLASPLPRHPPLSHWPARIIPIGAAACAIEPVGGEGMGTALRSAELAAMAILGGDTARLRDDYKSLWRRRGPLCRIGGRIMADGDWSDAVGLAAMPIAQRAAMWLVGK